MAAAQHRPGDAAHRDERHGRRRDRRPGSRATARRVAVPSLHARGARRQADVGGPEATRDVNLFWGDMDDSRIPSIISFLTSELMLDAASYLVATALGALLVLGPGRYCRWRLKPQVDEAYSKLRRVCEHKTLDPSHPGNLDFMKFDTHDFVNPLRPRRCVPQTKKSSTEWFRFFGNGQDPSVMTPTARHPRRPHER